MLRDKARFCDTCDVEIAAGESFRRLTLSADAAAAIVLSRGVGTVDVDIQLQFHIQK